MILNTIRKCANKMFTPQETIALTHKKFILAAAAPAQKHSATSSERERERENRKEIRMASKNNPIPSSNNLQLKMPVY